MKADNKIEHLEKPSVGELVEPDVIPEDFNSEVGIGNRCVSFDYDIYDTIASLRTYETGDQVMDLPIKLNVGNMPITELDYALPGVPRLSLKVECSYPLQEWYTDLKRNSPFLHTR